MKGFNFFRGILQHYNHEKYWNMREYIQNNPSGGIKKYWFAFRIKRIDYRFNASTGISLDGSSAYFASRPTLPHELNGIIIAKRSRIGKNARIFHQVTIGNDDKDGKNVPTIGDDVRIYPGAKILGKIHIGDRCIIGANVVLVHDVPDDTLVVVDKPRMIERKQRKDSSTLRSQNENPVGC